MFVLSPSSFDLFICIFEGLREHTCLPQRGHEVSVTQPAGDDMQMDVPGYPRPGSFTDVEAHIEALRVVDFLQDMRGFSSHLHDLGAGILVKVLQVGVVFVRHHHQMPAGVGEAVQDQVGANTS
jgi:hypothetical protein